MRWLAHEVRLALIGCQFLTRLPLPDWLTRWVGYQDAWLQASARHFPLVGAAVGAVAASVLLAAATVLGMPAATGLCIAASLLLTGGFHEDGWADTCDGLGGASSRQRALEIMKDSRIGAYGAMGLFVMLGLKWAALASMPPALAAPALLLAHTGSRTVAVSLIRWLPYAGDLEQAKAKPLSRHLSNPGWAVALGWAACAGAACLAWLSLPAVAAALLAMAAAGLYCRRWFRRRLGGYTGDCLGASQQLSELAAYLAVLGAWRCTA
ncbi:adenosylcobinamide-GDP ribazoletransferase [Eleftheria terrae]|uniref:adenosylcobinamide-GDP ribazoletransferase n=1 Tax=Eleftheria terrae TaxID=1597781 RepID=UPI00263BDDD1|nr:adenosylcobinamide-GDP ribazoletransferase [Eleftheria terrae]WKB53955.1 adenosylcobinamide-GDP ribazoletransferase [Eleftheria terrae]